MQLRAVVFDVGETILDRTREYASWADFFGIPTHTFSAVFGAMTNQGASVNDVLAFFGHCHRNNVTELRQLRGDGPPITEQDLYPDVRACLSELRAMNVQLGICGNQPAIVARQLLDLDLDVDFVASSEQWQLAKPSGAFFDRIGATLALSPPEIVYVGDQLNNDIAAARRAGLQALRIRRGPWGLLTSDPAIEDDCLGVIDSLAQLPGLLAHAQEHSRSQAQE
jgi:FMN phosphatase YigB (HAD superfamily)